MDFQIKILLISFVLTIIVGIIGIPILRYLKVGQSEREEGPQSHLKKSGTPTMGGLIMAVVLMIATIIAFIYYYNKNQQISIKLIPLLVTILGFGLIGFIDDFKKVILRNTDGIKPSSKMLGLLIISVFYILYLIKFAGIDTDIIIPFFKTSIKLPVLLYIPFSIIVILATTNAINLTDGIDGLGATVSLVIVTTLTSISIILGVQELVIIGSIVCGICLGFLIFNLNKAKVFMGDTGSLLLGGVVSCIAIYLKMPLLLLIIALVPVCETLSVILQVAYYKRTKKRIFKMTPIHHHFELSGWNENKIVAVFGLVTVILCIIGMISII